jgi:flavin reductase (DIM6/NTAB) family NADH-FMN oxidoreductase RutF
MQADDFKGALSRWATGVAVVVAEQDGKIYGLTVSSFTSVSLDPPLILACLSSYNRIGSMIQASGRFTVSILAENQQAASNWFAKPGREPTEAFTGGIAGEWTSTGQPVVAGAAAWLCCDLASAQEHGDHTITLGRVTAANSRDIRPLLYWNRGYRGVHDGS